MNLLKKLPVFLNLDNFKISFYAILLIAAFWNSYNSYQKALLYQIEKRQIQGLLTKKEHELQKQQQQIGVAKSALLLENSHLELEAKKYKAKFNTADTKLKIYVKNHNLKLQEFRHDIHVLNQTIKSLKTSPSKTNVSIKTGSCKEDTTVSYTFTDRYDRLTFATPNCLKPGKEEYTLNQVFSIYGEVYQQSNGLLKVSALKLRELDPRNNSTIIAVASLIKSDFKYLSQPISMHHQYDSFLFGLALDQHLKMNFNLNYTIYNYSNFYLNAGASLTSDLDLYPQASLVYRPTFLSKPINIGAHFGTGYSFQNAFTYSLGLSFFIW
jgi:hypothetical protein